MTNVVKNKRHTDMRLHTPQMLKEEAIKKAFEIIDVWLPNNYANLVREKIDASSQVIRNTKCKRHGSLVVINAMVEVALENKQALTSLQEKLNK